MNTIIPRLSEKTYLLSTSKNTYVFDVPASLNRTQVAQEVTAQYGVEVTGVRIAIKKGKAVRFIRKGGRVNSGVRADIKKAYVTLKAGQSLPFFAGLDEADVEAAEKAHDESQPEQKKRGIFGRKSEKATKSVSANVAVTKTQAKVGEK